MVLIDKRLLLVQLLELAECLFELLLGFLELFALIQKLAKCLALLNTLNAG